MKYIFEEVKSCNMCGQETAKNKVIGQRLNKTQGFSPKQKTGISTSVIICTNCSLIYSNPLPIPSNIQDHYGLPPEDYWEESYFLTDPDYFQKEINTVRKLLPFKEGMKALDIGAGLGKCMISLEKAGFDAEGFEPSLPFYERAISKMGISPDKLRQGMMEKVDYPNDYFDFITFGAVLEHLYNPSESIEKALRWLKPNGIIHVEVPSSKYLIARLINFYYKLIGTNYVNNISPMHEPFHLYEFDIESFTEHSKKFNYEIAFYEYYVCPIYHFPEFLHPPLKWYMEKTNKGMQLSLWLRKTASSEHPET